MDVDLEEFFSDWVATWGTGEFQHLINPDMPWNEEIRAAWARMNAWLQAQGPLHSFAFASELDVRAVLPTIRVPTLVVHHADDPFILPARGKYSLITYRARNTWSCRGATCVTSLTRGAILSRDSRVPHGHQAEVADDRVLATVLFTDIVDSTRRAAEIGDRDWHALLDAHDAVVGRNSHAFEAVR